MDIGGRIHNTLPLVADYQMQRSPETVRDIQVTDELDRSFRYGPAGRGCGDACRVTTGTQVHLLQGIG